jgi:GSH-dependent disulfide-bond oxidoreductase
MGEEMLTLWGMGSPNVVKVAIALEELGLAWQGRHVAVFKGEQFAPEFLALNPLGKVPVLEDPRLGRPLAESGAILIWLAEREGRFLPPPDQAADRAETIQWLMIQIAGIGPMFGQLNHFRLVPPDTEAYARARYTEQAERLYRLLEQRLSAHEYLAGETYSIADMAVLPWAGYLERHGFDPEPYPALREWRARLEARPAVVSARRRLAEAFDQESQASRKAATREDLDVFFARTERVPAADYSAVLRG